jgi:alpha-maltose-1-phosphate synthase
MRSDSPAIGSDILQKMRVALLTREYPPEVYGGAGVHVEYLSRELSARVELGVYCFGKKRPGPEVAGAYEFWEELGQEGLHMPALRTLAVNLQMVSALSGASLAHTHTWYANFAGHLAKLTYGIPHVMTSHSLEPLRPWKEEQLGGGYHVSSFVEKTAIGQADAVIAVSAGMRADILRAYPEVQPDKVHVIYNGIDTSEYSPVDGRAALAKHGLDPDRPTAIFVGRITRQKGVVHLLEAVSHMHPDVQLLLCAGAPDTAEIAAEVAGLVTTLQAKRPGIVWVQEMLPRPEIVALLSASSVFVCPSIYEPFGIVNVEAMGCGTAVVASAVGGIPEIVVEGETGRLVHFPRDQAGNPLDREKFARDFAKAVCDVALNRDLAKRMGQAGRQRAVDHFSWSSIADETVALYRSLVRV